jgi:Fe-S cluster assembly protein SufB
MTSQSENIESTTAENAQVETLVNAEYEHGFVTDIETDTVAPGLNEDVIRLISKKKEEPVWLLQWRLEAYRHWLTM